MLKNTELKRTTLDLCIVVFTSSNGHIVVASFDTVSIARCNSELYNNHALPDSPSKIIMLEYFLQVIYVVFMRDFPPLIADVSNFAELAGKLFIR